jgi:hypothetical protein
MKLHERFDEWVGRLVHFEGTTSLITLLLPCPLQLLSFWTFGNVPNALVGILQIVLNIFSSRIIIYYVSCQISNILKHNLFKWWTFVFENDNVYGLKYIQAFVTIEVWGSNFSISIHNAFFFVMEEFLKSSFLLGLCALERKGTLCNFYL